MTWSPDHSFVVTEPAVADAAGAAPAAEATPAATT